MERKDNISKPPYLCILMSMKKNFSVLPQLYFCSIKYKTSLTGAYNNFISENLRIFLSIAVGFENDESLHFQTIITLSVET